MSASIIARWALLFGLALMLSLSGAGVVTVPALLALGGAWNLWLSTRALRGRSWSRQAAVEAAGDLALAAALFYFSRTLLGPLVWAGLLPVASAALGYGLAGGLLGALVTIAVFAGLSLIDVALVEVPLRMALPAFAFLVAGSVLGFAGRQVHTVPDDEVQLKPSERQRREQAVGRAAVQAARAVNSTLSFDHVLEAALDLAAQVAGDNETPPVGGVLLFAGGGLRLAAARRLDGRALGATLAGQEGALAQVLADGQALVLEAPASDPELGTLPGLQTTESACLLPLRMGNDLFGVLLFAHAEPGYFNEERRELLEAGAAQVSGALQNALLYETAIEDKERSGRIEGLRITQVARRLHDGPAQSLAAIAMRVNMARRLLAKDAAAAGDELQKLENLSRLATREMRQFSFSLQPQVLEDGGLPLALSDLATQLGEIYNVAIDVQAEESAGLSERQRAALFAMAAEAMTNACQHAQARNVVLRLGSDPTDREVLVLDVRDDGVGFDPQTEQLRHNGGLGLPLVHEWAAQLGGKLELNSQPGGTQLRVRAPLNARAAERMRSGPAGGGG